MKKTFSIENSFSKAQSFVQDEKTGLNLAQNQFLVVVRGKTEAKLREKMKKIEEFALSQGWRIGGKILLSGANFGAILQILGDFETAEEIREAVIKARNIDGGINAIPDLVLKPSEYYPPDPLFDTWESTPGGNNWHFEYMNFPKAWEIQSAGKVKAGVIDFGYERHEDLEVVSEGEGGADWAREHGISVLGVLGARGGNGIGIAGAVWQGEKPILKVTDGTLSSLVEDIFELLEEGVKVILFAGGLEWGGNPEEIEGSAEIIEYHREIFSVVFAYVSYYDVLFVQSAGNEGIEAKWAGVGAAVKDLYPGNILIVGSVGLEHVSSFTNWGELVDVYAPGESIFTLCLGNSYCLKSGTSYSAALVAGLAVLIRSLREDLRAADVKEAIVRPVRERRIFERGEVVVPDAYLSLEIARGMESSSEGREVEPPPPYIPDIDDTRGGVLVPKAVECAVYDNTTADGDPAFNAPKCPLDVEACSSCGLLSGKDNLAGADEPNDPNVISTSPCAGADDNTGGYIERIIIESVSESGFIVPGSRIKVTVQAYCSNRKHYVDLLYTTDAVAPTWTYFGSGQCGTTGLVTFYAYIDIPSTTTPGTYWAIRARYQRSGSGQSGACYTARSQRDHDDIVFVVQNPPSSFRCGSYSSEFSAPICSDSSTGWCGTCGIARCRDNATSGEGTECSAGEPNTPNTIYSQCSDSNEDSAGKDEEIRRVNVRSLSASGKFEGGQNVEVSLLVSCFPSGDQIVLSYASGVTTDTTTVNWRYLTTIYCPAGVGGRDWYILSHTFRLDNVEGWHAIRAALFYCPGCSPVSDICPATYGWRDVDDFLFYVKAVPPSALPVCASFDPAYTTPKCPAGASQCSTCDLVKSRDTITPTSEQNQPNTLSTAPACSDGTSGTYLYDESIERIEIKSYEGTFNTGGTAEVSVLVYCWPEGYYNDYLQVFYTSDADNPTWTAVLTATCPGPGYQLFKKIITLGSNAGNHAIRASFQYGSFTGTCASSSWADNDDLVFVVGVPQAPANFKAQGVAPDSITLSWNDVSGETRYELRWTDAYNSDYSSWHSHPASPFPADTTWYVDRPLPEGTQRCYALRACNGNGCSAYVWDCATVPGTSANCATYDATWKVPVCPGGVNNCSTCDLVRSRDTIDRPEQNTPNTWYDSSCLDQGGGTYFGTGRSIEKITLTTSASSFSPGSPISITVQVYCASAGEVVGVYYSAGTSPVSFASVGSATCSAGGVVENKTFSFTPSSSDWYVIRAVFGPSGWTPATCSTVSQFEADDVAVRVGGVPPVPSGFDVVFVEPNTARVSWNDVSGETYYELVSAPTPLDAFNLDGDCGTGTPGENCGQDSTGHDHVGLGEGQSICFRLRACNGIGCSAYTPTKCTVKPPNPPYNLRITAVSDVGGGATFWVKFTDNSTNEDGFVIDRIGSGDSSWTRFEWWSDSSTKTGTGDRTISFSLEVEKEFCFRVASFKQVPGAGTLSLSSWADGVTRCLISPAVPGNFEVSFEDELGAVLSWKDVSGYETGYAVRKDGILVSTLPGNSVSFIDGGVSEGVSYTYSVSSYVSGLSVFAYGKTADLTVFGINRPDPVYVSQETSVVKVMWEDRSEVEDGYEIERSDNGGSFASVGSVGANINLFVDSSVSAGSRYCYRVRAKKVSDYSAYSDIKCVSVGGGLLGSVNFGSGQILQVGSGGDRVYVGTSTGVVWGVRLTDFSVSSSYVVGGSISDICMAEYGKSVTVIAVSTSGKVARLDKYLNPVTWVDVGVPVVGCAFSEKLYIAYGNSIEVRRVEDLGVEETIPVGGQIYSGPVSVAGSLWYVVESVGGRKICKDSGTCTTSVYQINTSLSGDEGGVYAGTSDGKIVFVSSLIDEYSVNLTDVAESITGVVTVYNRGGQKLLGVSTEGGKFYLVEVTGMFGIKVLWWKDLGVGVKVSPSLMQVDRVSVGTSTGVLYTYRITDGFQISSYSGAGQIVGSPISRDSMLIWGEGSFLRFMGGGEVVVGPWGLMGGDTRLSKVGSDGTWVKKDWSYHVPTDSGERYTYATPISYGGSVYAISTSVAFVPTYIFKFTPSGSAAGIYTYGASIVLSNISIGNVDGNPEEDVVVGVIAPGIVGYIHVLDLGLGSVKYSYALPSTLPAVRGVTLYDIVTGDGGRKELIFVAYDWREQRSRLYVLKYNGTTFVTHCTRDFAEQIRSIPLVDSPSGVSIVVGGGYGGGNLYVLDSSCNIQNTVSFAGSLKEGYLTDVDGDSKKDWVGGLTDGANNYAVVVRDVFGAPTTSWILLGSLDGVPAGENTVRGIVPADLNGDGRYESGVFVEAGKFEGYSDHISVSVVDLVSGVVKWRKKFLGWTSVAPVVGDFDGSSGTKEIVIGLYLGSGRNVLYMVDAGTGVIKAFWPIGLKGDEVVHNYSLSVADIDGDGRLELMVGGNKGGFYVFEFSSNNWSIDVPHFRKDKTLNAVW